MSQSKNKEKFENQWKRLTEILDNPHPEAGVKIPQNDVVNIFKELAEEREAKARADFKIKLSGILEAKIALDKNLKKGQEELKAKEEKEYEVLNTELNKAFSMLNQVKEEGKTLVDEASGNFTTSAE